MNGVEFVYALNLSRCIGCRKCVYACVTENNQSRAPQLQYIRVLKMEKGSIDMEPRGAAAGRAVAVERPAAATTERDVRPTA